MPKFREVTGQFVGYTPDSADPGITPDRVPMNGRVTFTPQFSGGVISFPRLTPPEFAHPEPIEARIVDGFVMVEVADGDSTVLQPVSLMVTIDDEATQNWSWRADFSEVLIGDAMDYTPIPSWTFRVPDGAGTVDLTELLPVSVQAGVQVAKGPRGAGLERIVAADGQLRFEYTDGQETSIAVPAAVPGRDGTPGKDGTPGAKGEPGAVELIGAVPEIMVDANAVTIGGKPVFPSTLAPATGDLNQVFTPGSMRFGASTISGWSNIPSRLSGPFILTTYTYPDANRWGWQEAVMHGTTSLRLWRQTTAVGQWGDWQEIGAAWHRGPIPTGQDVDLMRGRPWLGAWDISNATLGNLLLGTFPAELGKWLPGQLQVLGGGGGSANLSSHVYTPYSLLNGTPAMFYRTIERYQETGAAAWSAWSRLGGPTAPGGSLPVNAFSLGGREMRMQLFKDAYPLVSTGGKGAVVFRYDHGLTNFKNVLKPLHDQHGIPAYIAMNSRTWSLAENSGTTQAEAASWANVEWGNHTADHQDHTGIPEVWDTIVNGRIELEAQVGKTVHGFTVPGLPGSDGVAYNKLDGFGAGAVDGYSNSFAGSLVLQHHAIASGTIGAVNRPLDGVIRNGGRHFTWETAAWADIKAQIDQAIVTKTALTLMCHPRTLGGSGAWTSELAAQVIGYVKQQIDAGQLANISYYQSHHATTKPLPFDTGWREITERQYGWVGGTAYLRRINDEVQIVFKGLDGTNATNASVFRLPAGFGPDVFTGGSPAFLVRGQDVPDAWGSAGSGFFRLATGFIARTGTWSSIRFPAEAATPNMTALPGVARAT